ncbi:MAG: hypothetical protein N2748_05280 [candidate division WOR-3 bacterium]|nr:hypothetical protein [candidate division WOR-3 bacterium]
MKRLFIIIIVLILSLAGLFYGIKKEQPKEIEAVGSVMCLSCMGLQQ